MVLSSISSITNTFEHHFIYLLAISFISGFSSLFVPISPVVEFSPKWREIGVLYRTGYTFFYRLSLGYMYWYYLDKCIKKRQYWFSVYLYLYFDIDNFVLLSAWCISAHSFVCFPLNILSSFSTSVKITYFVIIVAPINKILGCYFTLQFKEVLIFKFTLGMSPAEGKGYPL